MKYFFLPLLVAVVTASITASGAELASQAPPVQPPEPSTPPIILPDDHYTWFVVQQPASVKVSIQRVLQSGAQQPVKAGDFGLKLGLGEKIGAWDAYGDWLWFLTNRGLYRMGRLRPIEGDTERFEPELIKPQIIGHEPAGMVIDDTRLLIATERGLYVFDLHTRDLFQVGNISIRKFVSTPYGIVAQTATGFFYADTSKGLPNLVKMSVAKTNDPRTLAQGRNFLMADALGDSLVAVRPDRSILQMNPENLQLDFSKTESIREARLFAGRLWLLTSQRLIALAPDSGETQEYDVATIEMVNAGLSIQAGVLRCGPITVTADGGSFSGQVIKLQAGVQGGTEVITAPLGLVSEKQEERTVPLSDEQPQDSLQPAAPEPGDAQPAAPATQPVEPQDATVPAANTTEPEKPGPQQ